MTTDLQACVRPTPTIDADHPRVLAYARHHAGDAAEPREIAVRLYYAVRDGFRYDPYTLDVTVAGLRASTTLERGYGWCVSKAVLLAACCRALAIPARLGFADVRNHLSTARMRAHMKSDLFVWHGYTSMHLDGAWVKATPAFNIELCERFRLRPLEFDGRADSIYHPFDLEGRRHMEYVHDRGEFADVPVAAIAETFRREYPALVAGKHGDFESDVARET
jgi:transglutaminase-like putative cysteine protease